MVLGEFEARRTGEVNEGQRWVVWHRWGSEVRLRRRLTKFPVMTNVSLISNALPMKSVGRTPPTRGHIPTHAHAMDG